MRKNVSDRAINSVLQTGDDELSEGDEGFGRR